MPQLPNIRQERYAQALARGLTRHRAYLEAGYRGNRACASRLARAHHLKARVDTLLARLAPGAGVEVLEMNLTGEQWMRKHAKPHLIEMGQWDHENDCQMGWSPLGGAG